MIFLGDVYISSFARFIGKTMKEAKQEEQKKKVISPETEQEAVKIAFSNALDEWRQNNDMARKLTIVYESKREERKHHGEKKCLDKQLSILLVQGRLPGPNSNVYPVSLRRVAQVLISLPVSSANVERVFSHLKLLYNKRRLNLNLEIVNELMFLGRNDCVPPNTRKDLKLIDITAQK